jgi:Sec-independent protein secretion pathway component TatC
MPHTSLDASNNDVRPGTRLYYLAPRLLRVWRELVLIALFVAMLVSPADPVSMFIATPPILFGVIAAYALACLHEANSAN